MTKWNPELQPRDGVSESSKMEWLVRSYRKISEWTSSHIAVSGDPHPQYSLEGFGGIYSSAPYAATIALTTSWQVIPGAAYDDVLTPNPIDVTQDITNGQLTINETGIWMVTINVTADIIPITANASNTVELAVYDVNSTSVSDKPLVDTVARYGEVIAPGGTTPIRITDAEIGRPLALAIRQRYATPAVTINEIISVSFHAVRVAKEA
jgi:hypothetical protein